jgi:hypothetical protein
MYAVQDRTQPVASRRGERALSCRINTTLYDLIEALQAAVPPETDDVVVATVVRLLQSGRITFLPAPAPSFPR